MVSWRRPDGGSIAMDVLLLPIAAPGNPEEAVSALQVYLPPILMVAGVVIIGFLLMNSVRAKIARRNADTPTARERIEELKAAPTPHADTDAAMAKLLDTAQRLASQLDAKAERLEQLLREADERIEAMETAPAPAQLAPPEPEEPEADPVTLSVYEMADAGRSPVEIAQALDEGVGKIELILALRARSAG
jgi:hypothetical protein